MGASACRGDEMTYDRYVYPGTSVLKNKQGIENAAQLEIIERTITADNIRDLRCDGITGAFDVVHLQSMHKRIFGDIYEWAGEFRDIRIYKGGTEFTAPGDIRGELERLFDDVRGKDYFRDMIFDDVATELARTLAGLNRIHPFREGNGRAQRIFAEQLAANAGYDLDFTGVSENDMRNASIASSRGRNNLMLYLIKSNMQFTGELGPAANEPRAGDIESGDKKSRIRDAFRKLKAAFRDIEDTGPGDRDASG